MAAVAAPVRPTEMTTTVGRAVCALVSFATALVILGVTMVPFFTPAWIHLEQDRAGSAVLTGYTRDTLDRVTDAIVRDLLLGGDFDVRDRVCPPLASCPVLPVVLDPAERSHMRDVRAVFGGFAVLVLASAGVLVVAAWRGRATASRGVAWQAVRRGAASLAVLLVVLGVIAVVAFDAAFELFHRILFPGGNFDFDPRTQKLVQLFPEQFWSETVLVYGAVTIAFALAVAWLASRRARPGAEASR